MNENQFCELVLTCASWQEAQSIVDALFAKKLIACAEFIEIKSRFSWKGKMSDAKEIKLIMLSANNLFDKIDSVISKLHSYETYVLQSLPVTRVSDDAAQWAKGIING